MHSGVPIYFLVDESTRELMVSAERVSGFFVDDESDVVFQGVHHPGSRRKSEEAFLEVRDLRQRKIGEYNAARVVRSLAAEEAPGGGSADVRFRVFSKRCDVPQAADIWWRWASATPLRSGEWAGRPAGFDEAWLHVVQNSWFASGHSAAYYGDEGVAHLDGAQFSTRAGFYCALGEAVNGPGGYFGSNLDALHDCLRPSDAERRLRRLEWRDLGRSKSALGGTFVQTVLEILREHSVDVVER